MSPVYNINDLTKSCTRMEIAISNLQKDVRDLKDMKSKIDSICTLLKKLNETQGATAVSNRAPQIQTGVMSVQDSSSILSQNERDIHKPTLKGTKYRKGTYRSADILQAFVSQLNYFTRTCMLQLINELHEKEVPEDIRSWKQVPDFMKDKYFLSLELMANSTRVSLDRCVNSLSAPSDTDDLPSIGSDDEEEASSEYSEFEQDVEEEASALTDSSSVKRKDRQASSASASKKM
ncbi:hypothetical protein BD770DRAFT_469652 [Pilaira anomala]|nr:hypothetical protein BD770DRAFT_469652 [Pilaira anomala]